ncbi:plant cysteine oxidase 1-like isoform X1 [Juglans microcarpa x Juglans regia]|uniref:plant cysteine oxidase 1-like isoform X1 n=1 Tax=Juglans microcarpa x Juglans regia TaxID=2249226 RepID=UPI001B7F1CC0|nr:plant cysteine oxidase 1-like isoform X1 [Juglans microcarpa x Juglans regia]XP_041026211.1 plant cysteine oxidase 1-like isoform X1 [Juglans microcarpa x Juglans regia]
MEAGLVERGRDVVGHVTRVGYVKKIITKRRRTRRIVRPPQVAPPMALQELFVSCLDVFKGPGTVPSPQDVQKLCHILDNMKPEDVGLSAELQFFKPSNGVKSDPRVTSTTIYKCDNFSLCMFFLPATGVIPLHNHPGMTVFSKLLLGTMHIKSYDWVDSVDSDSSVQSSQLRLAKLKADRVFTAPCDTSVLYPTTGGNIHAFTAITPCAVLDVLGPPYSNEDGRDCSFYKDHPYAASTGEATVKMEEADCYGWLEEIEMPENSEIDEIEYLGPRIIEHR